MKTSATTVVAIPRQRIWLLNNGIAVSQHRARAALNQLTIFRYEPRHVSRPLDADRGHFGRVNADALKADVGSQIRRHH
jgi:hypothetical protein